ncbi:MAG: LuxR family transcriptional regulator [Candidatus Thiodiazotropha sp. (ex Monitilora ramsayi)]|nr:LuxR family transcriptional regulator [Candidatus Thiodiazotropha sp. (ex Monitilora ramsayi)]
MSYSVLVMALFEDGQTGQAEHYLIEGLAISKGMNLFSSNLCLLAAYFALKNGDGETASHRLREGFGMAARQGYLNFIPWRDEIMTRLCQEALAAGIEETYVKRLTSQRQLDTTQPTPNPLTPKEMETLNWVKRGKTTWEIAKIQGISERTVKFHVGNILRKLDANSRTQAVAIALEMGFLDER